MSNNIKGKQDRGQSAAFLLKNWYWNVSLYGWQSSSRRNIRNQKRNQEMCKDEKKRKKMRSDIFPSPFLQLVNSSKISSLTWVMKLNQLIFFPSFFVFETPLKDFLYYSPIILTFWFRYLQTSIKESCLYLSSQLFFKTQHKTQTCVYHGATPKRTFN